MLACSAAKAHGIIAAAALSAQLPRIVLLHGTADETCPHNLAVDFRDAIFESCPGVECELRLYEGKTHTSPILEDPISGFDPLVSDILEVIRGHAISDSGGSSITRRNSPQASKHSLRRGASVSRGRYRHFEHFVIKIRCIKYYIKIKNTKINTFAYIVVLLGTEREYRVLGEYERVATIRRTRRASPKRAKNLSPPIYAWRAKSTRRPQSLRIQRRKPRRTGHA